MDFRIKLLPPDIGSLAQKAFALEFYANANEPDASLNAFHAAMAPYFPGYAVLGLSSGTAALHLGLEVLGVKKGDYVICPTFTFAATVNAVLYLQAHPVFVDSERESWNMDPFLLEEAIADGIKKGKKPAAIILVHAYGTPAKVEAITQLAKAYNIPLLEDAAPAFGSLYKGQMVGTFGDCGVFSFNYNKIITAAGGGMLISPREELIKEANYLANQARTNAPYYLHNRMGYNYRMNGLTAALGKVQLLSFQQKLERKKQVFFRYKRELEVCPGIQFKDFPEEIKPNYWLSSFLLKEEAVKEKAFYALQQAGIECRMLWKPMHLQPAFSHCTAYINGVAEELFRKGLSLPSAVALTGQEQEEIIGRLKAVLNA